MGEDRDPAAGAEAALAEEAVQVEVLVASVEVEISAEAAPEAVGKALSFTLGAKGRYAIATPETNY